MKKNILFYLLGGFFLTAFSGCAKPGIKEPVTLDKAAGKWFIKSVRIQVFNGSILTKDSLVPKKSGTGSYVTFDGISKIDYCFNTTTAKEGNYAFLGTDSISLKIADDNRRWKILLLTGTNFNIQTSATNNNSFPGATVITYQGLER